MAKQKHHAAMQNTPWEPLKPALWVTMAITAHPMANWQRRAAPRSEQRALWLRYGPPCESISVETKLLPGDFQTSGCPDCCSVLITTSRCRRLPSRNICPSLNSQHPWWGRIWTSGGCRISRPSFLPRPPTFSPRGPATVFTHRSQKVPIPKSFSLQVGPVQVVHPALAQHTKVPVNLLKLRVCPPLSVWTDHVVSKDFPSFQWLLSSSFPSLSPFTPSVAVSLGEVGGGPAGQLGQNGSYLGLGNGTSVRGLCTCCWEWSQGMQTD